MMLLNIFLGPTCHWHLVANVHNSASQPLLLLRNERGSHSAWRGRVDLESYFDQKCKNAEKIEKRTDCTDKFRLFLVFWNKGS